MNIHPNLTSSIVNSCLNSLEESIREGIKLHLKGLAKHISMVTSLDLKSVQAAIEGYSGSENTFVQVKKKFELPEKKHKETKLDIKDGEICIVKNYSDKCHAVFGDTKKIKDDILKPAKCKYNNYLEFGPGWIVVFAEYNNLVKTLKDKKIKYIEKNRDEIPKEESEKYTGEDKEVEDDISEVKEKAKSTKKKKETPIVEEIVSQKKLKLKKNKWGNYEDVDTTCIFEKNPQGKFWVCGYQDHKSGKVKKITEDIMNIITEKEWKFNEECMK